MNDLPSHRQQYGFDGFNFDFGNHLVIEGGVCVARRELPDYAYAIAAVRTGQFNGDGQIWNGGFDLAGPSGDGQRAPTSVPAPDPPATTSTPAAKTVGLFLNEPEAFDGYTLFNKIRSKTIHLIDNQGRVVHKWELDTESLFARLLENGNLLTFANPGLDRDVSVREVDRNGNILWDCTQGMPHHDFLKMPNGNVLLLSRQLKTDEEVIAAGANPEFIGAEGLFVPHIVEARITGPASCEIVWEWSAWDHLIQDFDSGKANYGVVAEHPELIDLNFHLSEVAAWDGWLRGGLDTQQRNRLQPGIGPGCAIAPSFQRSVDYRPQHHQSRGGRLQWGKQRPGGRPPLPLGQPPRLSGRDALLTSNFSGRIIRNGFPPDCRVPATSSFSTMATSSGVFGAIIRR